MGSIIRASCACGFKAEFFGGSERHNYLEVCYAPALCSSCGVFHVANYMDPSPRCPTCGQDVHFYNDPELTAAQQKTDVEQPQIRPEVFLLPRTGCLCPQCKQMTMHFEPVSCCE